MLKYYNCFEKTLLIEYDDCNTKQIEEVDFWTKKFTPAVKEKESKKVDYYIHVTNSLFTREKT